MIYDSREDFFLQLLADYALINEILVGPYAEVCLHKLGIKYGLNIEDRYRKTSLSHHGNLTAAEFSVFITELIASLGGNCLCKTKSEKKVEFICHKCPFKHMVLKSPGLCQVVEGIIGGIASRNFPYVKIELLQSQAKKDPLCQMVVFLDHSAEEKQSKGRVYEDEQTSYILTRNEIKTVNEQFLENTMVYDKYLQGFEDLKLIHREMETEYNQLRDEIFSDLKLGVLTVNGKNQITYMNQTAQELLPLDGDSLPGRTFKNILAETLNEKRRFNQHLLHLPFKDGIRYYSVNASPVFDDHGSINGAVSVFQDVTENKQLENELLQMEKFSLVAELAAGTAHEIRNPMTTLRGFLQILSQEFRPDTKGYEYCELMIEEIDRANSIIKEFLLLTKPAAPHLRETDLHIILEEIFLLIESKSLLENVELRKEYTKSLPLVKVDPAQIKQVFLNLATNAIQAMPQGGRLIISTQAKEGKAIIQFSDTGCGLEEAQLTKIFDPFFTTKENGTGLGLTISYRIIENHWGRIYAESKSGKGTTFTIELPAIRDET